MKTVKYVIVCLFIFITFSNSFAQEAYNQKINESENVKSGWPEVSECFGPNDGVEIYITKDVNPAYPKWVISLRKNGQVDNSIYNAFLNHKLKIECFEGNVNIPAYTWQSSYPLSALFSPYGQSGVNLSEENYFMITNAPTFTPSKIKLTFVELNANCSLTGNQCSNVYFEFLPEQKNLVNDIIWFLGDENSVNCNDFSLLPSCVFENIFKGELINNNDLLLSTNNQSLVIGNEDNLFQKINLVVYGYNGSYFTYTEIDFLTPANGVFNLPQNWSSLIPNFGIYDEYRIRPKFYYYNGSSYSCPGDELVIINRKTLCSPLSFLQYTKTQSSLDFKLYENDPAVFVNLLKAQYDMTLVDIQAILQTINKVTFKLEYYEGSQIKTATVEKTAAQLADFKNLAFSFPGINFAEFSGILKIKVEKLNTLVEECDDINIVLAPLQVPPIIVPENNCDPKVQNAVNLSPTLSTRVFGVGDIVKANNFLVVITKINSGSANATGINGSGIVALPFQSKQVSVDILGAQFNENLELIAGEMRGVKGTFNLSLTELPIKIGGAICLPPPPPAGYSAGGFNSATGLNKYGFNSSGIHYLTGGPYDPGGFDVNGIHKDTGVAWNAAGCTREGVHHETSEKCDPLGGTPAELNNFINQLLPTLDVKLIRIIDSLIHIYETKKSDCVKYKNLINASPQNDVHTAGTGNALIGQDVINNFDHVPSPIDPQYGTRNAAMVDLEKNHIALVKCEFDNKKYYAIINELKDLKNHLSKVSDYIKSQLQNVKQAEFDIIKKQPALGIWIATKILEMTTADENLGTGSIEDDRFKELKENSMFDALASNDIGSSKNISEEKILEEIKWLYDQEVNEINGIYRGFYTHAMHQKYLEANTPPSLENVLPLPISVEKSGTIYTIYIEKLTLMPMLATIDATVVYKDKKEGTTLAFGGTNIPILGGGINPATSTIFLKNDIEIKLLNSAKLILKKGNQNSITWDCDGVKSFSIGGKVQFCSNYIVPLEPDLVTVSNDSIYEFDFTASFQEWLDFKFSVKGKPFYIKGLQNYPIEIDSMILDYSKLKSANILVPLGYSHPFYNEGSQQFDPLWKGFNLHKLKVHLPKSFGAQSSPSGHIVIGAENAVFDDSGFSGEIFGQKQSDVKDDSAGEWAFGIDGVSILFLNNNIAGGGILGKIGVPILEDPLEFEGKITVDQKLLLKVKVDSVNRMPSFFGKVILTKNTNITCKFDLKNSTVDFSANLSGGLVVTADTGKLNKMLIPKITFENLIITNKDPWFSKGKWGVEGLAIQNGSKIKPKFDLFGIDIDSIYVHNDLGYKDKIYLGIAFNVEIVDSLLSAKGAIDIVGTFGRDSKNRQQWKHEKVRLNQLCVHASIKKILQLDACIQFFEGDATFGKGFRGAGSIKPLFLGDGISIDAVCQFGHTETGTSFKYYFIDLMVNAGNIATIGPITITGLGGGLSRRMYPDLNGMNGVPNLNNFDVESYIKTPLGTTITGVKYVPNNAWGYEFKLLTKFKAASKDLITGTGELIVRLNANNSLEEIEIRATVAVLKDLSVDKLVKKVLPASLSTLTESTIGKFIPKPDMTKPADIDAPISGYLSVKLNILNKTLHGKLAAYLDAPGITGAGPNGELVIADLYFGPDKWHMNIGSPAPGQRCGVKIAGLEAKPEKGTGPSASLEAAIEMYQVIGTDVPAFPGLPANVAHLGKDLNISEATRSSGKGFAFGAAFRLAASVDYIVLNGELNAGVGFDVMLKKYNDVKCASSNANVGINGWYAMGQIWAYIDVVGKIAGYEVLNCGVAAVLQGQFPNPSFITGTVEAHFGGKTISGTFESGDQCRLQGSSALGFDIIKTINITDKDVLSAVVKPSAIFETPLNKTVKASTAAGQPEDVYSFKIDWDSTAIFATNYKIPFDTVYDKRYTTSLTLVPQDFLPANDSFTYSVKVKIFKNGTFFAAQTRKAKFYTTSKMKNIPKENIAYSYPINGMSNFYKKELTPSEGFIKLVSGQGYLFNNTSDGKVKAKFTKSDGTSFMEAVTYKYDYRELIFDMDPAKFANESFYKLEIVQIIEQTTLGSNGGNSRSDSNAGSSRSTSSLNPYKNAAETVLTTIYFRTSKYNTFLEKMNSTGSLREENNPILSRTNPEGDFQKYVLKSPEKFDEIELNEGLLEGGIILPPYRVQIATWIKEAYPKKIYPSSLNSGPALNDDVTSNEYLGRAIKKPIASPKITEAEFKSDKLQPHQIPQVWACAEASWLNKNANTVKSNWEKITAICTDLPCLGKELYELVDFEEKHPTEEVFWEKILPGKTRFSLRYSFKMPKNKIHTVSFTDNPVDIFPADYMLLPGN